MEADMQQMQDPYLELNAKVMLESFRALPKWLEAFTSHEEAHQAADLVECCALGERCSLSLCARPPPEGTVQIKAKKVSNPEDDEEEEEEEEVPIPFSASLKLLEEFEAVGDKGYSLHARFWRVAQLMLGDCELRTLIQPSLEKAMGDLAAQLHGVDPDFGTDAAPLLLRDPGWPSERFTVELLRCAGRGLCHHVELWGMERVAFHHAVINQTIRAAQSIPGDDPVGEGSADAVREAVAKFAHLIEVGDYVYKTQGAGSETGGGGGEGGAMDTITTGIAGAVEDVGEVMEDVGEAMAAGFNTVTMGLVPSFATPIQNKELLHVDWQGPPFGEDGTGKKVFLHMRATQWRVHSDFMRSAIALTESHSRSKRFCFEERWNALLSSSMFHYAARQRFPDTDKTEWQKGAAAVACFPRVREFRSDENCEKRIQSIAMPAFGYEGWNEIVDEKTMEMVAKSMESLTIVGVEPGYKILLRELYRNCGEYLPNPKW